MRLTQYTRPEAALQRAQDFISVGKKKDALQCLYDMMKDRRHRQWTQVHESIMEKFVELCVDLKNSMYAKDGLYQYKQITQQVNLSSLEKIVNKYLELAEKRTEEARKMSVEKVEEIDDLDAGDSPENLLLSVVSGAATQDRMDRAVLSPWLRFLWDSYRNSLEMLRNNASLERMYRDAAEKSFDFCVKYQRRNEFRKLSDTLRQHLALIQRSQLQNPNCVKLNNPDSVTLIQETRLRQMDTAIQMELWQEAYKSAEDLHNVMNIGKEKEQPKKLLKPQSMASYYEKLALIFWKGGNILLHAAALLQKFSVHRDHKKSFSGADEQGQATRVLLAALSISDGAENASLLARILDIEEVHAANMRTLSSMLRLSFVPTKEGIMKEIVRCNIPEVANEHTAKLYEAMESDFNPVRAADSVQECLTSIAALENNELGKYSESIKLAVSAKVIREMATTHESITLERLAKVVPFYERLELETLLVDICKQLSIKIQIDHHNSCILFGSRDSGIADASKERTQKGTDDVRSQLQDVYTRLLDSFFEIGEHMLNNKSLEALREFVRRYELSREADYEEMLSRRKRIEVYKESSEKLKQDKAQQAQLEASRKEEKRRAEERRKLEEENKENDRLRRKAEQEEVQRRIMQDKLRQYQQNPLFQQIVKQRGGEVPQDIDPDDFLAEQRRRMDQEHKEQKTRLQQQEKRFDHVVRAYHTEEMKVRKTESDRRREAAPALHEQSEERRIDNAIKERDRSILAFEHLTKSTSEAESFLESIIERNAEDLQRQHDAWEERLRYACEQEEQRRDREQKQKAAEEELRRVAEEARKAESEAREKMREEASSERRQVTASQPPPSYVAYTPPQIHAAAAESTDGALQPPKKAVYRPPMAATAATGAPASNRGAVPTDSPSETWRTANARGGHQPPSRDAPARPTAQRGAGHDAKKEESDVNWRRTTAQ